MRKMFEVVKVFNVETFQAGDGDAFRFRLELMQDIENNVFRGQVYRLENYRLQPSFPQFNGVPPDWMNDALIFVIDDMFDAEMLVGQTAQDVVKKFQLALKNMFG